jgi:hypothetical protein
MTIEYVLLLFAASFLVLKVIISAPTKAFQESGPRLGSRIEKQLATGGGFKPKGARLQWQAVTKK